MSASLLVFTGLLLVHFCIFFISLNLFPPYYLDEYHYWPTSLLFSESLIPSLDVLRGYGELNTPLPFMLYGALEYFFDGGVIVGRLFHSIVSLIIACCIALPFHQKGVRGILCACGLLIFCPYHLRYGGFLYTDAIASAFVLFGFMFHFKGRYAPSCLAFVLAIASRQYMLAFPAALAVYEGIQAIKSGAYVKIQWISPAISALSILGWIGLFGGLTPVKPDDALGDTFRANTLGIHEKALIFSPDASLYMLASIGTYFVIPEWFLFSRTFNLTKVYRWFFNWKNASITVVLTALIAISLSPSSLSAMGLLHRVAKLLPLDLFGIVLLSLLSIVVCARFSKGQLAWWIVVANLVIFLKAYPWDKYVTPIAIVFWYLKSIEILDIPLPEGKMFDTNAPENDTVGSAN